MYTVNDLKRKIEITDNKVECPVLGCKNTVNRKRRKDKDGKDFTCEKHRIIITPSTFIYQDLESNLICRDDISLINKILLTKRESRLKNENSEDTVTWNVFRYLEKESLLLQWLNTITNETHHKAEIMYWSYCNNSKGTYPLLEKARLEFGENVNQGSEPDIIIKTDNKNLYLIEAKLFSSNKTSGSGEALTKRKENSKNYKSGGNNLFKNIFTSSYEEIIQYQKYELMRFWLLGYWMAKTENLKFSLINLVLDKNEKEIESDFGKHIIQNESKKFYRHTWESIYYFIKENGVENNYQETILNYFENKTSGYNSSGILKEKAFDLK
jgi:hypothetical protein